MNRTRPSQRIVLAITALLFTALACDLARFNPASLGRIQPEPAARQLFPGAEYQRIVRSEPRPLVIHVVTIDLTTEGLRTLVTPGNPESERPLAAQTTSAFLQQHNLLLAVNGDGFSPWFDMGLLASEPDPGDPVTPLGMAVSQGVAYSRPARNHPILYLYETGGAHINVLEGKLFNAISGFQTLVSGGQARPRLDDIQKDPRTAIGVNRFGTQMVIIVVDGRQPGYSEGVTCAELAALLLEHDVYAGMNMDGGGSSTLVVRGEDGQPEVLNLPIHNGVPGRQRPVANHLGFYFP